MSFFTPTERCREARQPRSTHTRSPRARLVRMQGVTHKTVVGPHTAPSPKIAPSTALTPRLLSRPPAGQVRVRGAPEGRGAARRVSVRHGRGDRVGVSVDGSVIVELMPLFDTVAPDDCTWTLDGGEVVVTMEKAEARPWATLCLEAR